MSSICFLRLTLFILLGLVWLSPLYAQSQTQAQPQSQINTTQNQALQAPGIPLEVQNNIRRFIQRSPTVLGLRTEVDFLDPSMNLPSCQGGSIEVLSAPNVRLWGRSLVQVRCLKAAWLYNIPLMIRVYGDYVVSTRYLQPGNRLSSSDMRIINGDLTSVPDDVIRTPKEADDRVLTNISEVSCRLETGRTHQIRVHLASLGHPLLGDTQYGGRVLGDAHRQMLHARRLRFDDPSTDTEVSFVAPVPEDMRQVLEGIQWK